MAELTDPTPSMESFQQVILDGEIVLQKADLDHDVFVYQDKTPDGETRFAYAREIFGVPVERRVVHSVRSASLETGTHPKRLRKLLAAAGLVATEGPRLPDNAVLFDAEAARRLLDTAADGMTLTDVETYLNAGRVQAKLLADNGFIVPVVSAGANGVGWHFFARADLDAFMARLMEGAVLLPAVKIRA